jgi:hypothetical protein
LRVTGALPGRLGLAGARCKLDPLALGIGGRDGRFGALDPRALLREFRLE